MCVAYTKYSTFQTYLRLHLLSVVCKVPMIVYKEFCFVLSRYAVSDSAGYSLVVVMKETIAKMPKELGLSTNTDVFIFTNSLVNKDILLGCFYG